MSEGETKRDRRGDWKFLAGCAVALIGLAGAYIVVYGLEQPLFENVVGPYPYARGGRSAGYRIPLTPDKLALFAAAFAVVMFAIARLLPRREDGERGALSRLCLVLAIVASLPLGIRLFVLGMAFGSMALVVILGGLALYAVARYIIAGKK